MDNVRITCDKTGYEFRVDGTLCIGRIDSGSHDADYEWFVRSLGDLGKDWQGWTVSFPEIYRNQKGHFAEGARFMTVGRPDGRQTVMEYTYRRLPWPFVRSLEVRNEENEGQLSESASPEEVQDELKPWQRLGVSHRKRRKRRYQKSS